MLQLRHPRRLLATTGSVLALALLLATIVVSSPVYAGGASGTGGDGTGGSGGCGSSGHWTCNGWGWARYDVKGKGPSEPTFRNGTTEWSENRFGHSKGVSQQCDDAGASTVHIFILNDEHGDGQGYNYKGYYMGPPVYSNHFDATDPVDHGRAQAVATETARKEFNDPGVPKGGLNWGDNVAWFCSDFDPRWSLEGSSDASKEKAVPGQSVTFYHQVKNNGPDPADYGWRVQMAVNPSNDGNGENDGWTNIRGGGNWPKGSPEDVAKDGKSPNRSNYADVYKDNAKFKIPDGAKNGDKYCQRIEYSNANGPNTRKFPNDAAHSDKKCVTVEKGPTKCEDDCEDRSQCTYLEVYNKGTYNHPDNPTENHNTRAHVEVTGVKLERMNGANASGNDIDDYAPDDSGGQNPRAKKRWAYTATTPTIKIHVTHEWHNDTGWHKIDGQEYTWNVDCHSAQCVVTSVTGPGPGGAVMAGKPATIRALIRNNFPAPGYDELNNPYLSGMGIYSSGVGILPSSTAPPGTNEEEVDPIVLNAPTDIQNPWQVKFSVSGADVDWGNPAPSCTSPTTVYKPFSLETIPTVTLDDEENPTKATYSTSVVNHGDVDVNGPTTNSILYKISVVDGSITPLTSTVSYSGPYADGTTQKVVEDVDVNLTPPFQAGDRICAAIGIANNQGLVGPGGTTAGLSGGDWDTTTGTYRFLRHPASCAFVHNEPYVHFNGADVSAGGKFEDEGGSCNDNGGIKTFSKERAGTSPPIGSGVHIGALAIGPINGFNSANIRNSDPIAPIGLSFSNTDNITGGAGNNRNRGGNLGGNNCVLDYFGTKPSSLAKETNNNPGNISTDGSVPKITKYYEMPLGTPLNIGASTIANSSSEVIYVKGDVNITGNITLADNWGTIEAIPSLYIIASGNINIAPNVTRLDGIYIAQPRASVLNTGYINTCTNGSNVYSDPSRNAGNNAYLWDNCRSQLVVNGAFVARGVYLERSLGTLRKGQSGEYYKKPPLARDCDGINVSSGDCAAEIFNFGSEQYLAQPALPPRGGPNKGTFDYITSLAPVL